MRPPAGAVHHRPHRASASGPPSGGDAITREDTGAGRTCSPCCAARNSDPAAIDTACSARWWWSASSCGSETCCVPDTVEPSWSPWRAKGCSAQAGAEGRRIPAGVLPGSPGRDPRVRKVGVPFSTLAERVQDRLPRTLRNQVVYELCGSLAAEIWRLQEIVGEARDPVVELDRHHPGWRERLPLLVSDEVTKALLRNLLTDAAEVVNMGGRLRWERFLEQAGEAWILKGRLELPASLGLTEVEGLFGLEAANRLHHAYFDVLVQPENSAPTLVAMASPRHDPLSGDYFSLEHARPVSSDDGGASGARSLLLRHRDYERASEDFRGASPMSDLPWAFVESSANDAPQSLKFVGEGTVSVREPRAFVALTEAWTPSEPGIPVAPKWEW